jgi:hypothetical protein
MSLRLRQQHVQDGSSQQALPHEAESSRTTVSRLLDAIDRSTFFQYIVCTLPSLVALILLHLLRSPLNPFQIPLFDTSSTLLEDSNGFDSPTLRWDAIHFLTIGKHGYAYEQQAAFQPGVVAIYRLIKSGLGLVLGKQGSADVEMTSLMLGYEVVGVAVAGLRSVALFRYVRRLGCISQGALLLQLP